MITRTMPTGRRAPDVLVLSSEWPERALLRAQLIQDGHEVAAIDASPIPTLYRQEGMKPRVLVIDLRGLPSPQVALADARLVLPADSIVVVTALGTINADDVRRQGFIVIERPATMGRIAAVVSTVISRSGRGVRRRC